MTRRKIFRGNTFELANECYIGTLVMRNFQLSLLRTKDANTMTHKPECGSDYKTVLSTSSKILRKINSVSSKLLKLLICFVAYDVQQCFWSNNDFSYWPIMNDCYLMV
jgi:hypothetical protein